jgi:glycosyltransferase involved in cell wall biosynthesis
MLRKLRLPAAQAESRRGSGQTGRPRREDQSQAQTAESRKLTTLPVRILLLNNLPAPYFTPLFARLAELLEGRLTVCYSSDWNQTVGWEADSTGEANQAIILDRRAPRLRHWFGSGAAAALALWRELRANPPDFVICYGYTLLPQFVLLLWAIASRTPYALSGDANFYNDAPKGLKGIGRTFWLRFVVGKAAALIAVGSASRMFWEKYGARPEQIFQSGFAVNNEALAEASLNRVSSPTVREGLSFVNKALADARATDTFAEGRKTVFLFVGRLVERKNVRLILQAARRLDSERFAVVIAGSGEQFDELKALGGGSGQCSFSRQRRSGGFACGVWLGGCAGFARPR